MKKIQRKRKKLMKRTRIFQMEDFTKSFNVKNYMKKIE